MENSIPSHVCLLLNRCDRYHQIKHNLHRTICMALSTRKEALNSHLLPSSVHNEFYGGVPTNVASEYGLLCCVIEF